MEKDFTVINASWHTKRERNYEFDNQLVYKSYKSFFVFLQDNSLVTRKLIDINEDASDDTKLMRSDLTNEGLEFFKVAYGRWIDNIFDRGKSPEDVKYLEKKLKEIRGK
ncbi:hypothetical protein [Lacihabitans lacunae]|uniref:Uncharacterized protein n=1 Tax=Lacihabitans lacunae TaxID=1028214 RepID=A0ABV7Z3M4_9BACT